MSCRPNRAGWLFASLAAACLWSLAALGQDATKAGPAGRAAKAPDVTDAADLEAFFDGAVPVQLRSKHIAGAVVAVVADDRTVLTKGYGYADVAERRKVDPATTQFRIGSITKLFTWTAVMQLVEEGKLDLDADVNTYLRDVQVPAAFDRPVTLKDLLTHTPGFDDYVIGLFARKPDDRPLAKVLTAQMPTRVRPPGALSSYSNHGTAIAGHAVACASGLSWEEYVERRVLKPLGMSHTLARQPAESELPATLSKGYKWEGGRFVAHGFEYVPAAPAGGMSMTAADAARFMRAHLNDGRLGDGQILRPETARRMREPLFRHHPKTAAMCYGLIEERRNGQRLVGHGGATHLFHSLMNLIPDRRVGVFISYNTADSRSAHGELLDAFLGRYFPHPDPPRAQAAEGFRERAGRLAGEYGLTRYSHSTATKLAALMGVFKVSVNDDDTLTIRIGDSAGRYVEVEPLVYRELDGTRQFVFQADEDGNGLYLFPADAAPVAAVRRAWYERSAVHWGVFGASVAVFASALLFWPVIAFSVRGLHSPEIRRTRTSGLLSALAWAASAAGLAFTAGLAFVMGDASGIAFGLTPLLRSLLALTQVCAALAALTVVGCVFAWKNRYWRLSGRLHYTLVALAGVAFTWFLAHWNLLTFGLPPA